jgi:hypothetical protein
MAANIFGGKPPRQIKKTPIAMIFVTIIIGVFPLMMTRLVARL